MVWHGSGLVFRAGQAFRGGDFATGQTLLTRGLAEMDRAVELAPDDLAVRIPRGTTLINLAKNTPIPGLAERYRRQGAADYRRAWELQRPYFDRVSVHARGELLTGLADAHVQLGDLERALEILAEVERGLPETSYADEAARFRAAVAAGEPPAAVRTCHGCHPPESDDEQL